MAQLASAITGQLASLLRGEDGVNSQAGSLMMDVPLPLVNASAILELQAAPDVTEKAGSVHYPVIHVYCDRFVNSLKEKFRSFSGTADLTIEIRVSNDRLDRLQGQLHGYVEAVTAVLDQKRGDWSAGAYYGGGYEVLFGPVKRGGLHFLQTARVQLQLNVQRD